MAQDNFVPRYGSFGGDVMKRIKHIPLMILLLLALFSLAGCSSGVVNDDNSLNGSTPTAVEPDDSSPQTTQETATTTGDNQGDVDQTRAEEIALTHAKLDRTAVASMNSKLDDYNGITVYEVKFIYSGKEYEYKIHAQTGEILEAENDD